MVKKKAPQVVVRAQASSLRELCQAKMAKDFLARGDRVSHFWEVESWGYSKDALLAVWQDMAKEGLLEIITCVYCEEGHLIWQGEGTPPPITDCNDCDEYGGEMTYTPHALITDEWVTKITKTMAKEAHFTDADIAIIMQAADILRRRLGGL